MKKRFFFAMALAAVAMVGNAQDAYVGNKFFDNRIVKYLFGA